MTPSLAGLPTKAKEAPSPDERGKTGPTGHQPSISMSQGVNDIWNVKCHYNLTLET